jgi:hypothetical protein
VISEHFERRRGDIDEFFGGVIVREVRGSRLECGLGWL